MDAVTFSEHLKHINIAGFTAVGLALGHELGLFDVIMAQNRFMTSQEIADVAGMKERYVREWLGAMVTAKIIIYDPNTGTYSIPEDRHDAIKGVTPLSAGVFALGRRKDDVKACFMKDGPYGFDFDHDDDFWSWFSGNRRGSANSFVNVLINQMEATVIEKLERGINVLDVGCGSAELTIEYARKFPNSTFLGLDFFDKGLIKARENARLACVSNLHFLKVDCHKLPESMNEQFDMVTLIDTLHDLPDPSKALNEIGKVLKSDGVLSIEELGPHSDLANNIGDKMTPLFYVASVFVCLPSGMSTEPRAGYGACWGREKMELEIGRHFTITSVHELPSSNIHYICSKK